ncbi:hypothetical protein, partial [Serratia marcescens]|uniref:hypothetical protein n=1 Tax=Serratia marcescens TaxID=615 RepID=UPI001E30EF17
SEQYDENNEYSRKGNAMGRGNACGMKAAGAPRARRFHSARVPTPHRVSFPTIFIVFIVLL